MTKYFKLYVYMCLYKYYVYIPGLGLFSPLSSPASFTAGFGGTTLSWFTIGFSTGTTGLGLGFGLGVGIAAPSL